MGRNFTRLLVLFSAPFLPGARKRKPSGAGRAAAVDGDERARRQVLAAEVAARELPPREPELLAEQLGVHACPLLRWLQQAQAKIGKFLSNAFAEVRGLPLWDFERKLVGRQ